MQSIVNQLPVQQQATEASVTRDRERAEASRRRLGDVIFVSLENWDEIWRRNQFVCAELAHRFHDSRVLFVGMPRDVSRTLRDGSWRGAIKALFSDNAAAPIPGSPNLILTRPVKLLPNSIGLGRRVNQAMFRRHIRRHARQLGIDSPLLWLNAHWAGHLAGTLGERAVVYDITDDWALAGDPGEAAEVRKQDLELCRRADLVVVCSEALRSSRQPNSRRVLLLPNGVNSAHYAGVLRLGPGDVPEADKPAAETANWHSPVFGYTGTVHPERINVDLVLALAKAYPQGTVALVGPEFLPPEVRQRLLAARNVKLVGPVPYSRIPRIMAAFDVCIVPHCESPFTESLNPIKLWEYLAAGKPMVSANVAGFRDYPKLCRIASGEQAFVAACRDALAEAVALAQGNSAAVETAEARRVEAAGHSWASRVDVLLGELHGLKARDPAAEGWKPPLWRRALRAMVERGRLLRARIRHPHALFGRRCIVRPGLNLSVQNNGHVEFGPECVLDSHLTVECFGKLRVGANVIFGHHCTIGVRDLIQIGDDSLIAELVSIRDHDHRFDRLDVPVREQGSVSDPVRIGRNVWIGCKATVLKGVTIGDNAVIGANAVVTRDIPANAIAVGVPARVIRYREAGESDGPREPVAPGPSAMEAPL
jgi:acetyltransferase-like isoleucine patch superfamily enzyme/glycosyltransferase involved in cell wall biosynthesis